MAAHLKLVPTPGTTAPPPQPETYQLSPGEARTVDYMRSTSKEDENMFFTSVLVIARMNKGRETPELQALLDELNVKASDKPGGRQ